MKHFSKLISLVLLLCTLVTVFVACGEEPDPTPTPTPHKDYVSELKLDMSSTTFKYDVTGKVKSYIDGDTTHFNVPSGVVAGGVLKARYLAVDTPESTGKVEEWGKKAAAFTKETLKNAHAIMVESDNETLNADSTGSRYMLWIWYQPTAGADYRLLNLELLQNGYARASNAGQNRYGETCLAAIAQARAEMLYVYSGKKDPDFYYGEAVPVTMKELRANPDDYVNTKVAVSGVITQTYNNGVYAEAYDDELGMYCGLYAYYGFNMSGGGMEILQVGNEVLFVGTFQFYETGGTYQISGMTYREMKPDDPGNIQKLSDGHSPAYVETAPDTFVNDSITLEFEKENDEGETVIVTKTLSYAELAMNTSISMKDLRITGARMTDNEESSSYGDMTLTCQSQDGSEIQVRVAAMFKEGGALMTEDDYVGKTIDVKGVVEYFMGYQIKVLSESNIVFH